MPHWADDFKGCKLYNPSFVSVKITCVTGCQCLVHFKVLRKSNISKLSLIRPKKGSLFEKKNAVYYSQISLFIQEMFKFLKYAKQPNDYVIHSTKFCSNMINKEQQQNCVILCSKILL